jgi:hypothetical protein
MVDPAGGAMSNDELSENAPQHPVAGPEEPVEDDSGFDEQAWGMTQAELEEIEIDPDEMKAIVPMHWQLDWSDWIALSTPGNPAKGRRLGVYRVRAVNDGGQPIHIPRALGTDIHGIMYIGMGNLHVRVGLLMQMGKEPRTSTHTFASTYREFYLFRLAEAANLQVQFCESQTPEEDEFLLTLQYKQRFGDLPPGNRRLGG